MLPRTEDRKVCHRTRTHKTHHRSHNRQEERHKRLGRQRRSHQAQAGQRPRKHHQAKVTAPHGAEVDIPCRLAKHPEDRHIRQRRQQGHHGDGPRAQEFGQDHLSLGQGTCQQQFKRALPLLLRKRPHRHGRHQEHQDPRSQRKKARHRGHPAVQDVPSSRKDPQKQAGEQQEHRHNGVPHQGAEEAPNFFQDECPHWNLSLKDSTGNIPSELVRLGFWRRCKKRFGGWPDFPKQGRLSVGVQVFLGLPKTQCGTLTSMTWDLHGPHHATSRTGLNVLLELGVQRVKGVHRLWAECQPDHTNDQSIVDWNSMRTGSWYFSPSKAEAPPYPELLPPMQMAISRSPIALKTATGSPGVPSK